MALNFGCSWIVAPGLSPDHKIIMDDGYDETFMALISLRNAYGDVGADCWLIPGTELIFDECDWAF